MMHLNGFIGVFIYCFKLGIYEKLLFFLCGSTNVTFTVFVKVLVRCEVLKFVTYVVTFRSKPVIFFVKGIGILILYRAKLIAAGIAESVTNLSALLVLILINVSCEVL